MGGQAARSTHWRGADVGQCGFAMRNVLWYGVFAANLFNGLARLGHGIIPRVEKAPLLELILENLGSRR